MEKAKCTIAYTAISENNTPHSVMISQVLLDETVSILETNGNYLFIETDFDKTKGWVDGNVFDVLNSDEKENNITVDSIKIVNGDSIIYSAKQLLNVPFLYGGRSEMGLDGSGFVQLVFKNNNICLPRFASQQAEFGEVLFFAGESNPGDLAFFENENGEIDHCGILLNSYEIIHCFGKVRVDALDSSGIYNQELRKHTHKLRFIRTLR